MKIENNRCKKKGEKRTESQQHLHIYYLLVAFMMPLNTNAFLLGIFIIEVSNHCSGHVLFYCLLSYVLVGDESWCLVTPIEIITLITHFCLPLPSVTV